MGINGSTTRKVTFGLDEDEKVTIIEGVKLSENVLKRMRDAQGSDNTKPQSQSLQDQNKPPPPPPPSPQPPSSSKPAGPSASEMQEEMRREFERQQAIVREKLAKLSQMEAEAEAATCRRELVPALIIEKEKAHEEQQKAKMLAKMLARRERELAIISNFYKAQLEILEKRNWDKYNEKAGPCTQADGEIKMPRPKVAICAEVQARVHECYRENPKQVLNCNRLTKEYINCVQQAKNSPKDHGSETAGGNEAKKGA